IPDMAMSSLRSGDRAPIDSLLTAALGHKATGDTRYSLWNVLRQPGWRRAAKIFPYLHTAVRREVEREKRDREQAERTGALTDELWSEAGDVAELPDPRTLEDAIDNERARLLRKRRFERWRERLPSDMRTLMDLVYDCNISPAEACRTLGLPR